MSASDNMSERSTGEHPGGARHAHRSEPSPSGTAAHAAATPSLRARIPTPPAVVHRPPHGALTGVLDHLRDGVVVYDPSWRFHSMNRSAEEHIGAPASGVLGRVLWEAFPALKGTEVEARYRRAVETQQPVEFELTSPITGRWVEVRAFPSEQGLTVIFRDMTARHDAELARRRGEDAMAFLASASLSLGASLDARETVAALARLVVPSRADACVVDLVERDRLRRVAVTVDDPALEPAAEALRAALPAQDAREGVRKVLRTGEPALVPRVDDAWLREVAGDSAYVSVVRALGSRSLIMVPLATAGRRVGVLTLARIHPGPDYDAHDLSVARRLADHAALALENARIHRAQTEALRQRDEVLGVVSHDLRNPLHAIALNARIVSRRSKGADEAVADLQTAIDRANRLVEDLLATVCADADALRLTRSYENLSSIFGETLSLHRTLGEERAVRLAATIDPRVPEVVFVDRHRLLQCVCNLVGNALKFTPSGGAVTVRAAVRDAHLVISVEDTGPGIAADEVPHLFDRFWQGAARRRGDAGLGLSIVKAIAEAHGGCVDVRTALGAGTTFDVVLPIVEPQDGRGDSVPPPERVVA